MFRSLPALLMFRSLPDTSSGPLVHARTISLADNPSLWMTGVRMSEVPVVQSMKEENDVYE